MIIQILIVNIAFYIYGVVYIVGVLDHLPDLVQKRFPRRYSTAQVVFQNPPRAGGEWLRVERIKF